MIKRTFDVVASLLALAVLAPAMVTIAFLIWVMDGRPVLFKQLRVGRWGHDFLIYKFRTMTVQRSAVKGSFDAGDASRVTSIGRILRKSKLDELPQFWNVLRGDMSLVGPRPEVRRWVEAYPERWATIHQIRPGITDPASVMFRNEEELLSESLDPNEMYRCEILPTKLDLYEQYVKDASFVADAKVLVRTATRVLLPARRAA